MQDRGRMSSVKLKSQVIFSGCKVASFSAVMHDSSVRGNSSRNSSRKHRALKDLSNDIIDDTTLPQREKEESRGNINNRSTVFGSGLITLQTNSLLARITDSIFCNPTCAFHNLQTSY